MLRALSLSLLFLLPLAATSAEETPLPNPQVVIKTNEGEVTLRLFRDKAPITVANFLAYVDAGHYNGTIFHRVIPNFMIQGGGFLPDMTEKETGEPIVNESRNRLHNVRGTIAMARTAEPDSATAQFFINQRTNLRLDWTPGQEGYTVFGEVTDGMAVVDYIASSPVQKLNGLSDVPTEPIMIKEIVRKPLL
ncbi:peptidylprolyl isomerase [Haliea sp. E1-2-M8]|uniref:peptidylprolyl isomerase n=1 Tax=Haliea sp. E1-2-M8 TaxID=3064706 RepID=UPI0027259A0E|nr:peptidylprolyl isomerase [Haliea sp. E1-2-M8]MDO8862243.1 peptidylprolyl isomerase [Haliea sp. E1-2-M8]